MGDYLKAYVQAIIEEAAQEDAQLAKALHAKEAAILQRLQQPYQDAIRLQTLSRAERTQLAQLIATGAPQAEVLDLSLKLIAHLCGDENFYHHPVSPLGCNHGDIPAQPDQQRLLKREYNHLLGRVANATAYLGDERVPYDTRQGFLPVLDELNERMVALLKLIGECELSEVTQGFKLDPALNASEGG